MDRHIDLDSAMIAHLEGMGYRVTKDAAHGISIEDLPALIKRAVVRSQAAGERYGNAWDCLSQNGLAEIIIMKANRMLSGLDNGFTEVVEDSLVDIINYSCKLYEDLTEED